MKLYLAKASCDWGYIYDKEKVKASSWRVAFARAGGLAKKQARRQPRQISISIRLVGEIKKETAPQA